MNFSSLNAPLPHGSECLGISLVTPLAGYFCGVLILELHVGTVFPLFSVAVGIQGVSLINDILEHATALSSILLF